jgi:Flp pilus assembly protein TadG
LALLVEQSGQVMVLAAVGMVAVCGMAGFAIDVGVWFQAHRKQQSIADATALAAASDLPASTSQASTDATVYAGKNGGAVNTINYSTTYLPNDTVTVTAQETVPAFFLKVIGFNSTTVKATSVARAETVQSPYGAAPFAVINTQPQLVGAGCPCFGAANTTTLDETKGAGPGAFQLINIDGSTGGTSPDTLASWITNGCGCTESAPLWLYSDAGAKFNPSQVQAAMDSAVGRTLLFPVYDQTTGTGSNLRYHVIGWAGFHITAWSAKGTQALISGYFTPVDWGGGGTSDTSEYFGATTARLVG